MKKQRNRARRRLAEKAIDRTVASLERAGIRQDRLVVRLGGQRPKRYRRPETEQPSMQKQ